MRDPQRDPRRVHLVAQPTARLLRAEVHLIATTSVGSSIGRFGPENGMTPEEITKAFLAIRGLTEGGLAARMMCASATRP